MSTCAFRPHAPYRSRGFGILTGLSSLSETSLLVHPLRQPQLSPRARPRAGGNTGGSARHAARGRASRCAPAPGGRDRAPAKQEGDLQHKDCAVEQAPRCEAGAAQGAPRRARRRGLQAAAARAAQRACGRRRGRRRGAAAQEAQLAADAAVEVVWAAREEEVEETWAAGEEEMEETWAAGEQEESARGVRRRLGLQRTGQGRQLDLRPPRRLVYYLYSITIVGDLKSVPPFYLEH